MRCPERCVACPNLLGLLPGPGAVETGHIPYPMFNRLELPSHAPTLLPSCVALQARPATCSRTPPSVASWTTLCAPRRAAAALAPGAASAATTVRSSLCVLLALLMIGVMVRLDCCLRLFKVQWAACTRRPRPQSILWVVHAQPHPCPSPDPHLPTLPNPEIVCLQATRTTMSATFTTPSTTCLAGGGRPAAAAAVQALMAAVTLAPVLGLDLMGPMGPTGSAAAAAVAAPVTGASSKPSARVARQERPSAAVRSAPPGGAAGASSAGLFVVGRCDILSRR